MAGNTVALEFAGDAEKLKKAAKESDKALNDVGKAAGDVGKGMEDSGKKSGVLLDKFSKLGNATSGLSDAIGSASGLLDDFNGIQQQSYEKSQHQKRALQEVNQAQQDYNQSIRDSRQAVIDAGQAQIDKQQADLDASNALKQYNEDVKKHGKASAEARQDLIDLKQAQQDSKQATEDGQQALEDGKQAVIDAKDAQLDLNDANKNAHPPDLAKWSADLQTYTPLLGGLIGVMGLVTAAQYAWNAAQLLSPTTWIIAGIAVLIGIIVLIATKTTWFQDLWKKAWGWIKTAASNSWDFIKKISGWIGSAFSKIGSAISSPFRAAFNFIADAWNNTVGKLSWTVPGWVPFIGGDSISVPHLPKFHNGGTVPGTPGSEMLAVLQAGETVTPAGGGPSVIEIRSGGSQLDDLLVEILSRAVGRRGGNVQLALGGRNA